MDDVVTQGGRTEVVELSRDVLLKQVTEAIEEAGLSLDEFIELGHNDVLRDEDLRDLWLAAAPLLSD